MRENNMWISEDRDGFLIQDFPQKRAMCSKNYKSLISSSSSSVIPLCIHSGLDESTFCIWNSGMAVSGAEQRILATGVHPDPGVKGLGRGIAQGLVPALEMIQPEEWSSCKTLDRQKGQGIHVGISCLLRQPQKEKRTLFLIQNLSYLVERKMQSNGGVESRVQASVSLDPTPFAQ